MALSEEAIAELQAAGKIVRQDFSRETVASVLEEFGMKRPAKEDEPELDDDGKPKPPPVKEKETPEPERKRGGVWWTPDEPKADKE